MRSGLLRRLGVVAIAVPVAVLLWAVLTLKVGEVHIPVRPQGDVAVGYWSLVIVLAFALSLVERRPLKSVLARMVPAALVAHLGMVLGDLTLPSVQPAYTVYTVSGQALLLAAAGALSLDRVWTLRRAGTVDPSWLVAIVILVLAGATHLSHGRLLVPLALTVGGLLGALARPASVRMRVSVTWPARRLALVAVAAVFVIGLALREAAAVRLVQQLGPEFAAANGLFSPNGVAYDEAAWALATGTLGRDPGAELPRGYWTLLAFLYRVFDHRYLAAALVQGALSAIVPMLTYAAFRGLIGRPSALLAAALVSLSGTLTFTSVVIGNEAIASVALALSLVGLFSAVAVMPSGGERRTTYAGLVLAGSALGVATVVDPRAWLFGAFLVAWIRLRAPLGHAARMRHALVLALAWASVTLPFVVWDIVALGAPVLFVSGASDSFASCLRTICIGPAWKAIGFDPFQTGWRPGLTALLQHPADAWDVLVRHVPVGLAHYFIGDWVGFFDPTFLNRVSTYAQQVRIYAFVLGIVGFVAALRARHGSWHHIAAGVLVVSQVPASVLLGDPWVLDRVPSDPILLAYVASGAVRLATYVALDHEPSPPAAASSIIRRGRGTSHSSGPSLSLVPRK